MTVITRLRCSTRTVLLALLGLIATVLSVAALPVSATVQTATYTGTQTIPVPPASAFGGSAGGDGWDVALNNTQVFNVFHHNSAIVVACHLQSDASACWSADTRQVQQQIGTDGNGDPVMTDFASSGHSSTWLDQSTNKLYTVATRISDSTGGVVCVDTVLAATSTNPFCGFTALGAAGDSTLINDSGVSNFAQVGTKLYAFNYANGVNGVSGTTANTLFCFDTVTDAACTGQPFTLGGVHSDIVDSSDFPSPGVAAIGGRIFVPLNTNSSAQILCFNPAVVGGSCGSGWPVDADGSPGGTLFPLLDTGGSPVGVCIPDGLVTCFDLTGTPATPPSNLASAVGPTFVWNGPAVVIGSRVYVPNGNAQAVDCFDYATNAGCANFPYALQNLDFLYTVNADPQRPTCLWVNSNDGTDQIQNFDAFSTQGCGQGPVRILSSSFVVNNPTCVPLNYLSLQVTTPAPADYTSATVAIHDSADNAISGLTSLPLTSTGTLDLSSYNLTGYPQFLITFNGLSQPSNVTAKLVWSANYDQATCTNANVSAVPDSTPSPDASSLVYDGATAGEYSDAVTLSATLTDTTTNTKIQGATVSFSVGGTSVGTGTTNSSGVATKSYTLPDSTPLAVVASYAGGSTHSSASDTTKSITVSPDECTLAYTGDTQVQPLANANLAAQMADPAGSPGDFAGHTVTFTVKNSLGVTVASPTAPTNSAGAASVSVPLSADAYSVDVASDANSKYAVCTPPATTVFTVAAAGSKVTGGGWSSNNTGRMSFGFNLVPQAGGAWTSEVQIRSNSNKNDFHGRGVTSVTQLSTHSVRWTGSGTWNGVSGATFTITVTDGKPDTINITITSGGQQVLSTGGTVALKGGNLVVH